MLCRSLALLDLSSVMMLAVAIAKRSGLAGADRGVSRQRGQKRETVCAQIQNILVLSADGP